VTGEQQRVWDAGRPVDLRATLGPLRRGAGDPAHRVGADGRFWWACATPAGPATLALASARQQVTAHAWGTGAGWALDRVPALLGERDDWAALDVSAIPVLDRVRRTRPGMRLVATGLVLDSLVPAILEQKVTGQEAWRSWRELVRRFGEPAPGPAQDMLVPPGPRALLDITTWDWHRIGVDLRRQRTIRAAASVARRLEECAQLTPDAAFTRLQQVPGIGVWTAAETVQRAFGHPDAVSVGDYHLPNVVVHLFTGRARGTDDEMLALLAPWAGQRQRVMRLIEAAGIGAPRFGPRFRYLDARVI
jgi:3-methyladenine DNA glycosylase/8-oxoguanine DNA glycosylase